MSLDRWVVFPRWSRVSVELAIVLVTGWLGLLSVAIQSHAGRLEVPVWMAVAVELVGVSLLVWRRQHPILVLATTGALSLLVPVTAVPVAIHAVGRFVRSTPVAGACLVATAVCVAPIWLTTTRKEGAVALVSFVLAVVVPWFLGRAQRSSIEIAALRTAQERIALDEMSREIRDAERAHLAREMHDVVAHRISLVVLQANLLDTMTDDPRMRTTIAQVRDTGRAALDEMRDVLGLLKRGDLTEGDDGLARHALDEIEDLVQEARSVGQPVALDVALERHSVPDLTERTVYRIVREGLTNAVRHAPGASTDVSVRAEDGSIHVAIANAAPSSAPTGLTTGGHGIRGLRERVALVGGSITAGPTPDGGFVLDVRVPRRAA